MKSVSYLLRNRKKCVLGPYCIIDPCPNWPEFCRMPLGLRNAAQTFQRFMDTVLRGLDFAFDFVDDILVSSASQEEHLTNLRALFTRLAEHGLVINPAKCVFGQPEVNFLSHTVSANGIRPHITRVEAVRSFPIPTDQKTLHQFVGLVNYYHRFVPRCAEILAPLHQVLSADSFTWSEHCQHCFRHGKTNSIRCGHVSSPTTQRSHLHHDRRVQYRSWGGPRAIH